MTVKSLFQCVYLQYMKLKYYIKQINVYSTQLKEDFEMSEKNPWMFYCYKYRIQDPPTTTTQTESNGKLLHVATMY